MRAVGSWAVGGVRRIDQRSPLQVPAAVELLGDGVRRSIWAARVEPTVVGRVHGSRVRLVVARPGRNSFRPVLLARLVPAPTGCRLVGTVGVHPVVRWLTRCWVVGVLVFTAGGVVGELSALLVGDGHDALEVLPFPLVGAAMAAFGIALTTLATRSAAADCARLVAWADEHLRRTA